MSIILKQPVTGPAAWTGQDIQNDTSWIEQLHASDIQALDEALAILKSKGRVFPNFGREDFPIGTALLKRLAALSDELENGRGFSLWRGLPVHQPEKITPEVLGEFAALRPDVGLQQRQGRCRVFRRLAPIAG